MRYDNPLVLLHEEVGPVADVKVGNDDAQLGHGPQEQPHVLGARRGGRLLLGCAVLHAVPAAAG